jgi:spectinomycin phosphotransferase
MRAAPESLETRAVVDALREGWGFDAVGAEHAAIGGGSYHWIVTDVGGLRRFVTVDELGSKTWLGDTYDETFTGLSAAFATAADLRESGLAFVVAPLPALDGMPLRRLEARYSIALFPFVDGRAGKWGPYDDEGRRAVVSLLAELHHAMPARASHLHTAGFELPGRDHLEAALRERDVEWTGGPLSEPAREAIRASATELTELLALADRLAGEARAHGGPWVVTHGEPHAGNVIRTTEGYVLVDWDTVALGPPERDLWLVVEDGTDAAEQYENETGRQVDETALDFFRVTWDLKDLAEYLNALRAPHTENEDTLTWYGALRGCRDVHERWSSLIA